MRSRESTLTPAGLVRHSTFAGPHRPDVHEAPRLARTVEAPLAAGMVVTIEPGIYRPGWGGVRIEDDVLITESGGRVLTSFPRALLEIV